MASDSDCLARSYSQDAVVKRVDELMSGIVCYERKNKGQQMIPTEQENFRNSFRTEVDVNQAICDITRVQPSNTLFVGKCCYIMRRIFEDCISPDKFTQKLAVSWCLKVLSSCPKTLRVDGLKLLETLLTKCDFKPHLDQLISVLRISLKNETAVPNSNEILLQRFSCMKAAASVFDYAHVQAVKDMLLTYFKCEITLDVSVEAQVLMLGLETLEAIVEAHYQWLSDNLSTVLSISLAFASYGLPHHVRHIPCFVLPSSVLCPEERKTKGKGRRWKSRKPLAGKVKCISLEESPDTFRLPSASDSDVSDVECSLNGRLPRQERKVRSAALSLLLATVKGAERKEIISYWNNILSGPYSILSTLQSDSTPRCRVAICSILSTLVADGKIYISQAQHPSKNETTRYTSWSHLLADLLTAMHSSWCATVSNSFSSVVTTALLQFALVLIRHTPYHRLCAGLLTSMLQTCMPLLKHKDQNIKMAAIKCIGEIINLDPSTEEQLELIRSCRLHTPFDNTNIPSLVNFALQTIEDSSVGIMFRAECWIVVGSLAKSHFEVLKPAPVLTKILKFLLDDLESSNPSMLQKASKAFEYLAVPLAEHTLPCANNYEIWSSLLDKYFGFMLQSTNGLLAAAAADCIAKITDEVFEQLPENRRIFIMTALCGCVEHESHVARSAAVRTLGTIVMFPFLSKNIQIIYDVTDRIVCAFNDEHLLVRTKAAWALGNLSDVLIAGKNTGVPIQEVPLLRLIETSIKTGNDHEKVKTSSLRAVGNLMLLIEEEHLNVDRIRICVEEAAKTLVHNATSESNMKVRWNACYAIGNMLKNDLLLAMNLSWESKALETLTKLIAKCSNFKVRQAAAWALSTPHDRRYYGSHYHHIWNAIFLAFDNSQNLPEFSEYKHQRNLIEQLCLTTCHIANLMDVDDLITVSQMLAAKPNVYGSYFADTRKDNEHAGTIFDQTAQHIRSLCKCQLMENDANMTLLADMLDTRHSSVQLKDKDGDVYFFSQKDE